MPVIRPIAICLPQFHPIPENDKWWGKGFTEWTNVTKSRPLFEGHYQPHLPSDLGFYDLRLEEARLAQEELAKEYGIYGFCYYHYWFNGKRLLHEPLERKLKNPKENLPFMLCWANENWTRRWDGEENEILIKQEYSEEDDINHINFLCSNFFKDERYIKVQGKPVLIIYKPNLIPEIGQTIQIWRREVRKNGFSDVYLCFMDPFLKEYFETPKLFNASVSFHPDYRNFPKRELGGLYSRILHKLNFKSSFFYENLILNYKKYVEISISKLNLNNYLTFPGVMPSWDNRARRQKNATIFLDSSPDEFKKWLESTKKKFVPPNDDENFLFINAMNEWAEGNHLEPCQRFGNNYLLAIKKVIKF